MTEAPGRPPPPIEILKAIAHPLRYAILSSLRDRELNVGQIEAATGIHQPTLSQQLSVLRNTRLVTPQRKAKLVFYKLERTTLAEALEGIAALTGNAATATTPSYETDRLSGVAVFAKVAP